MANTIDFILTNAASELISKVLSGKTLNFTRMAVGDGFSYDTAAAKDYTALVNEVLSIDITKSETLSASSVKITSAFKNTDTQKEFYYREVGLYAQDPDTGEEILYAYGNRNDAAELITPTGSSVVTKQLVFIISVGDSANVTFNVNADVYALQEDMLDVQENKADKNLANTGMITNCLLEVPQIIKLELNNGVMTLKAGSVVIVPNGFETDGTTPKFDYVTIKNDKSYTWTQSQSYSNCIWFYSSQNNIIYPAASINETFSGDSQPTVSTNFAVWYDLSNNKIKCSQDKGLTWTISEDSFPFAIASLGNKIVLSIDQIFNGMGFIGSSIWIDKGVKGLIPNGRNPDGTLNNIEFVTTRISVGEINATVDIDDVSVFIDAYNNIFWGNLCVNNQSDVNAFYYNENQNFFYMNNKPTSIKYVPFAKLDIKDKKIVRFTSVKSFEAINKSTDKQWLSSLALPSEKFIDYELGERGTTYLAPANGWFALRKDAGFINAQVSLAVWNSEESFEFFRTTKSSPAENTQITCFIPILKGQKLAVDYDATGTTIYFRFIYAQGEAI